MRGDNLGFKTLMNLFRENRQNKSFSIKFAQIIIKKPSKYITKENGFVYLNKMYQQRLFTTLYPVVQEMGDSHQMMQVCSLVSLQTLENQNRLQELIPLAQEALKEQEASAEVKLTSLALFRKILIQAANENAQTSQREKALNILVDFIPSLLDQLKNANSNCSIK